MTAAFYCVADDRYFLGAVAMINSLRLHGHDEPVFVLDRGLAAEHRRVLAEEATIVTGDPAPPWLSKTVAPMRHRAEVMLLIDADMIVTRSLSELVHRAAAGRVVAFRNDRERFVPEWGELLGLGPASKRPYLSSGLVLLGGPLGVEVLELLDDRQRRVEIERTFARRNEPEYPFLYPEQDVLNAILCTRVDAELVDPLPHRLAPSPPFAGVRLVDADAVRCCYRDGDEPYVLHHFARKPWLEPMRHGLFSRLFARLLLGERLALRVDPEAVPLRMRDGLLARAERARVDVVDAFRRHLLERAGAPR